MIFNGARLIVRPAAGWGASVGTAPRGGGWLATAALTAALWPVLAVVGGHLGSHLLGHVELKTAIQRAMVGFVAALGGALVLAPAYALALIGIAERSRREISPRRAMPAAMGIVWPAFTAGLLLALPPLLGLGPEPGEILWAVAATALTARVAIHGAAPGLEIRRRWRPRFVWLSTLAFAVLFAAVLLVPAMTLRSTMGVASRTIHLPPTSIPLPLPPEPSW